MTLNLPGPDLQIPPEAGQSAPCPIGVFDSGVGGLSVTRELLDLLPDRPILYVADQANAPYGERSLDEIRRLAHGITRFMLGRGACVIVIACNTASAAALYWLRREFPEVPFVGMEPALKPAVERTQTRSVGVIATPATVQGELFASLIRRFAGDIRVHTQVCPDLVPLVEAGELDSPRVRQAVERYLAPLLVAGIDELVLGCTHYPFLRPVIAEVAGPHIEIIDPSPAVARQTSRVLAQQNRSNAAEASQSVFYTTGDPDRFSAALRQLLGLNAEVRQARWNTDGALAADESQTYPKPIWDIVWDKGASNHVE